MNHFHLSLPCHDTKLTKDYYLNVLGASTGRQQDHWIDIDLYGSQITFNQSGKFNLSYKYYRFERSVLPSFHFGLILKNEVWNRLYQKLLNHKSLVISETTYLKNKIGEHQSFFVRDPNDYYVEFKCFTDIQEIFRSKN